MKSIYFPYLNVCMNFSIYTRDNQLLIVALLGYLLRIPDSRIPHGNGYLNLISMRRNSLGVEAKLFITDICCCTCKVDSASHFNEYIKIFYTITALSFTQG